MAGELISFGLGSRWIRQLWTRLTSIRSSREQEFEEINKTITFVDPMEIARYYIEPDCQDVNPTDHHEEQFFISKEPVMKIIDQFFQIDPHHRGNNQMFVLSDAGMGKTALLTMLKFMHLTGFWPKRTDCVLKKLGKDTLEFVGNLENQKDTILLLDSLDEDPMAYGRVQERLLELLRATRPFEKIIISCRTQFFPKTEKDPFRRPGFFKIDEFSCPAKYLSFFTDGKVREYLTKRFPKKYFLLTDTRKMEEANRVIKKMGSLRCRPMLLSYIEDLMAAPFIDEQSGEYQVYDALVKSWLSRENEKNPAISEKGLLDACIILATVMQIRNIRSIPEKDLDGLIDKMADVLPIKKIEMKGRSLINRNSDGDYRFSHYSVQEFCVVKLLLEKPVFKPKGRIPLTDFMVQLIRNSGQAPNYIELLDFGNIADLSGLNLSGADLSGMAFSGANLSGVNLSNTNLHGANLSDADLSRSDFNHADLRNADLKNAKIENTNFNGAIIKDALFDWETAFTNELGMEFTFIPPGRFMMGSPGDDPERFDWEKQHEVILTQGFYLQTTPVTQGQWKAVMGDNPSRFKKDGPDCPVENVSWHDAREFMEKLNASGGEYEYRLPTEAQWEYACRAGTTTPFWTGKCLNTDQANYDGNRPLKGCPKGEDREKTTPVKTFAPNPWGLYDMHGNVWEWCSDWDGDYPDGPVTDPVGPSDGAVRVFRGGSWSYGAGFCRSANRISHTPVLRDDYLGFRVLAVRRSR